MKYFEHKKLFDKTRDILGLQRGKDYALQAALLLDKLLSNLYYLNIKIEDWNPPYTKQKNDRIQAALTEKNIIPKMIDQYSSLTKLYYGLTSWGEDSKEVFLNPCRSIFVDILRWYFNKEEERSILEQIFEEQNISGWYQKITTQEFKLLQTRLQKIDQELEEEINERHAWGVAMHAVQQNKQNKDKKPKK